MKEPIGVFDAHIDTAVAAGGTKVMIPRSAVEAVTEMEVHGPGNVFDVIART